MGTFSDYVLSCSSSSDHIARHNDTRDLVFRACRSANLSPVLEAKDLSESSRRRPGDIFIPNWAHSSPASLDVILTCPLKSTSITRAAEILGYSCKLAEELKSAASAEHCEHSGVEFIPPAFKTSGGLGSSATSFLTVLAERWGTKICETVQQKNINFSNASTWPCTFRTLTWFCHECRSESINLLTSVFAERSYFYNFNASTRLYQ